MVFNNNYSANKVDFFLERHVDTAVRLKADGSADVETTVTLENRAPAGPPSLLLGPATLHPDDQPGTNRMILNVLLPEGADADQFRSQDGSRPASVYRDLGHKVVWDSLIVGPGEIVQVSITYEWPDAVELTSSGGEFAMTLFPQATVNADDYSFRIEAPNGHLLRADDGGGEGRRTYEAAGTLDEPRVMRVEVMGG
jgi:hypothetical protein